MKKSLILLPLLLTACAQPVTQTPQYTQAELEQEQRIQQQMANEKAAERVANRAQDLGRMQVTLGHVAARVIRSAANICGLMANPEGGHCAYDVVLFQAHNDNEKKLEQTANAWADGRRIVVTPALMRETKNEDELAFIVSHEMAHNMMGHVTSGQTNALIGSILGVAVDALVASQGVSTGGAFSNMGGNLGQLVYSPAFEQEADYVGLYIMARAGYNIHRAPDYWRRDSIKHEKAIYMTTTHPTNPARFISMQKTIAEIDKKRKQRKPLMPEMLAAR